MEIEATQTQLWPVAVYFGAVILLAAFMVVSSYLLGQRHMEKATGEPYESGIKPTGSAWIRFDVKYYAIAMFFVIFDVETVFVYAWAVALYDVGWVGFAGMAIFIGTVLAALAYLWRVGALDWVGSTRAGKTGRAL